MLICSFHKIILLLRSPLNWTEHIDCVDTELNCLVVAKRGSRPVFTLQLGLSLVNLIDYRDFFNSILLHRPTADNFANQMQKGVQKYPCTNTDGRILFICWLTTVFCEAMVSFRSSQPIRAELWLSHIYCSTRQ